MGRQWLQGPREAAANKRGALIGKLAKEIAVAAKMGDPHPESNPRLAAAVEAAKKQSVPKDTIERAIKKGAGLLDEAMDYALVLYEGYAPHKVPVLVECLTDNRNRTASDIRVLFRKGSLGAGGSMAFLFDHLGVIEASHPDAAIDLEAAAIEAGAQQVEPMESEPGDGRREARFVTERADLDAVSKALSASGWTVTVSELSYLPKNPIDLDEAQMEEVRDFLVALNDHDDVHRVHAALRG